MNRRRPYEGVLSGMPNDVVYETPDVTALKRIADALERIAAQLERSAIPSKELPLISSGEEEDDRGQAGGVGEGDGE